MKLYISPSNQPSNVYAWGNTTEKKEMEALAQLVASGLLPYDITPIMASFDLYIRKDERPREAMLKGCDFYIAFHTNAGGKGLARGPVGFYNPAFPISRVLAENIVSELNAITPHGENRNKQVVNGMTAISGKPMGEIKHPGDYGIPATLIELDFHDNPVTAQYIVENKDKLAKACIRAIVKTFNLKKKESPLQEVEEAKGLVKVIYNGEDGVNVRTGPYFDNNVVKVVHAGEVFTVVGEIGSFYKLKSGLYITKSDKFVEFMPVNNFTPYHVEVVVPALNIRSGPGTMFKDVGTIRQGDVYTIIDEKDNWGKLKSGAGWISLNYTKKL